MTPEQLAAEVAEDPAGLGYAEFVPHAPGRIVELLNEPGTASMVASRFVSARTVLAEAGALGAIALSAMEGFDLAGPGESPDPEAVGLHAVVHWAMHYMKGDTGIDIGHPTTGQMLDALVLSGVLSEGMAEALKGMAMQPCSRYALLAGDINAHVWEREVRAAIALIPEA